MSQEPTYENIYNNEPGISGYRYDQAQGKTLETSFIMPINEMASF